MANLYTQRRVRVIEIPFDYTLWTTANDTEVLRNPDGTILILSSLSILGMTLDKLTPLNEGVLSFGNTTSTVANISDTTEVAGTTGDTVEFTGWKSLGLNGLVRTTGDQRIYSKYVGSAAPTTGDFRLYLQVYDWL